MAGTLNFTRENRGILDGLKYRDYESWHIVTHGRAKGLTEIFKAIDWENNGRGRQTIDYKKTVKENHTYINVTKSQGASKAVLVFGQIVIKSNLPTDKYGLGNQVKKEVELYQKILYNGTKEHELICPILKYFPRENISIQPKVERVGRLRDLIEETGVDAQPYRDFIDKYNLWDCWNNGGNAGILNGRPVILDYAL